MSLIVNSSDKSRGGFQNRDVGRSNFRGDFGPNYGTDYARLSDPPDPEGDLKLLGAIEEVLYEVFDHIDFEILVKNGFIFLKGNVHDEKLRDLISRLVSSAPGVIEVQNHLQVS